jgi:pimeloyl-ACP methyl ester carboxylesterase
MVDYKRGWGDPDNQTVILLHPAGGTRHNWTPHAEDLRDDYHIVALDLPAHGVHPDATFGFDRAVNDVGQVLTDVESAVVGGHSQGGYVAARAAAEYPESVDGLILGGASYKLRSRKLRAVSTIQYALSYVFDVISHSERASEWVLETFGDETDPEQDPPEDEETQPTLNGTAQSIRGSSFAKNWAYIDEYGGPVLAAHGEDEMMREHAEQLATRDHVELRLYEGGHQAPMTNADEFATIVREFLDQVYEQTESEKSTPQTT